MTYQTSAVLVLTCTLTTLSLSACVSLRNVTAGRIGCRPQDIVILDEQQSEGHHWIAECQGRRYQCSEYAGVACTRDQTIDAFAEDTQTTSSSPRDEPIERALIREGTSEFIVLRALFRVDPYRYAVAAAPIGHPTVVTLSISAPVDELPDGCAAGVMVDGQITHLHGTAQVTNEVRQYVFPLDIAFVRRIATAQRAVGRVCDIEWRLGETERQVIGELVARYDEETAWAGPQTSGGESVPPPAPSR